jgi:predicted dehydrogenase/threonine dehydrogenase-like Zn-dependent dehydrogenase
MRQVLGNSSGPLVARVPRPALEPGTVLVETHYSMVSTGTELAGFQPPAESGGAMLATARALPAVGLRYLRKAMADPAKAAERLAGILTRKIAATKAVPPREPIDIADLAWKAQAAQDFKASDREIEIVTDRSPARYQAATAPFDLPEGYHPRVTFAGKIHEGAISIGFLSEGQDQWLGASTFSAGDLDDGVVADSKGSRKATLVIANAGHDGVSRVALRNIRVSAVPNDESSLPMSEMGDTGWNLGYSLAGEVIAVGDGVQDLVPGDFVACSGAGQANHAEYAVVRRHNACKLPKDCAPRAAASATIGTIAMQGVRRAEPQLRDRVLVLGLGLIGLITVRLLRLSGCEVIGFDPSPARRDRAKAFGLAAGTSDPAELERLVRNLTGGRGVDRTIVTASTKSSSVVNDAMRHTRRKGRVVIVGDVGLEIERADFYKKEIDLLMSSSYGPGRYDRTYEEQGIDYPYAYVRWTSNRNMQAYLELLASGDIDTAALIDAEYAIEDVAQAYRALGQSAESRPIGVVLRYPAAARGATTETPRGEADRAQTSEQSKIVLRGHRKARPDRINFVLVGAGAFGQSTLVPKMEACGEAFFLKGVVSRDAVRGGNYARSKNVEILASEIDTVLQDPAIDLVVIATRHDEHAAQVIEALGAGKHVFVEKPLATSWQDLAAVEAAYRGLEAPPMLMVGFNRRFAPAIVKLREILRDRSSPAMICYRLNGGYIPADSWIQNEQGAGRNIGEACHMYDLFRSIAAGPVVSIAATAIQPGQTQYFRNDNFVATIGYQDGCVGTLTYTASGPKQGMPKERIEVFCDGEAYIVDDFVTLTRASDGAVLWKEPVVDKGHAGEMRELARSLLDGNAAPISFDELVETTAVSLHVEDLIFGRA